MSYLPFGMIYMFSHVVFFHFYYIIPYRRKVVDANISRSFPNLSESEHKKVVKDFYKHLSYLLAESVKNLSISEKQLKARMKVRNPEIMDDLYVEGKEVLLLSSHFHNWELLITAQNLIFRHQAIGIGMPLSNKFWDRKINDRRERFGMKVVNATNYKAILNEYTAKPTATLILGDQSPSKDENCYWTDFLNQKSAFFFGAEILANQRNAVVVYAVIHRQKRGFYEIELRTITESPLKEEYGMITSTYIKNLENDIRTHNYAWLWSHKRWKKQVPENIVEIEENHKERFLKRFRSKEMMNFEDC